MRTKPHTYTVICILIGLCLILLWLLPGTGPEQGSLPGSPATELPVPATSADPGRSAQTAGDVGGIRPEPTHPPTEAPASDPDAAGLKALQASVESALARHQEDWKKPISFYGKVVDEHGQSVESAEVSFCWNDLSPSGTSEAQTRSDAQGLFSLIGVTGRGMMVTVSKEGYYLERKGAQFWFEYAREYEPSYHRPDPTHPVIFRLRKKGPGANLITSEYGVKKELGVRAPLDGTPVRVDFRTRKVGDHGPLEISQLKPQYLKAREATEWSFHMRIPDGGFVEQDDEFPFEAPEAGYQPTVDFHFKVGTTNWTTMLGKKYYIVFGQPRQYGWLNLDTELGMGGARLQYAINPEGSRYLEPREQKYETPPPSVPGAVQVVPRHTQ